MRTLRTSNLRAKTAIATISSSFVLAACGGGGAAADPAAAMREGLESLSNGNYRYTLQIDPGSNTDLAMAGVVGLGGRMDNGKVEMAISAMNTELATMRFIDSDMFLSVDVGTIAALAGGGFSEADIQGLVQSGVLPGEIVPAVTALLDGDFVKFDGASLTEDDSAGGLNDMLTSAFADTELTPEQAQEFVDKLMAEFSGDNLVDTYMTVTETAGADGERVLNGSLKLQALATKVLEIADSVEPVEDKADAEADIAQLPEEVPGLSMTLDGENVTELTLDIEQLAASMPDTDPSEVAGVAITLVFTDHGNAGSVDAVSDAVVIDAAMLERLSSLAGGF